MPISNGEILKTLRKWEKPISRTGLRKLLGGKNHVNAELLHRRLKGLAFQGFARKDADDRWSAVECQGEPWEPPKRLAHRARR